MVIFVFAVGSEFVHARFMGLVGVVEIFWSSCRSVSGEGLLVMVDPGPKVGELVEGVSLGVIDGDDWQCGAQGVPPKDVGLLQTDGYSEIFAGLGGGSTGDWGSVCW